MDISTNPRENWSEYADSFNAHQNIFKNGKLGNALPKEDFYATVSSIFTTARTTIWKNSKTIKTDEVEKQSQLVIPWLKGLMLQGFYAYPNTDFFSSEILSTMHNAVSWNYHQVTVPEAGNYKCAVTGSEIKKNERCYLFVVWYKLREARDDPVPYYYYISKHKEHEDLYLSQILAFALHHYYQRYVISEVHKWRNFKAPKGKTLTDEQRFVEFTKDFGQISDLVTSYTFLHNLVIGKIIKSRD